MPKIHLKYPILSLGIDYVSLSYPVAPVRATHDYCLARLGVTGEIVLVQREQLYGYDGYRHGGRYVGIREDRERDGWWRIYELASSAGAAGHDLACCETDVTVNRLDIQATLLVCEGETTGEAVRRVNAVIRRVRDHVVRYAQSATGHMRRLSHSWLESSSGGIDSATLYIGSRSSDVVTRIYNKTAEMRLADGAGLLRVEIELKDSYAERARQAIVMHGVSAGHILAGMLARYDIVLPDINQVMVTDKRLTRRSTDRTIAWLGNTVSKTVARLVAHDGLDRQHLYTLLFGRLGD